MNFSVTNKFKTLSLNRNNGFVGRNGLWFLNIAQFLGALNDNLFKFLTIYLLIGLKGIESTNDILCLVGIVFVLPFILFSSVAGILADRFSKQKLIVLLKAFEIVVIAIGFFAYSSQCVWLCYFVVFLLSLQSALMAPSKYAIIAELVKHERITKANGLITSFTYLASIFGTFFASLITQLTNGNFILAVVFCMIIAIVGFVASLYIPHTLPEKNRQKISPFFLSQIAKTLKGCRRTPKLLLAVCGAAFFLFVGGFMQLNVIPFAVNSLGLSEVGGGYLFLVCAVGIVAGSTTAGKTCKMGVNLGVSCFGMLSMAITFFTIPFFSQQLIPCIIIMALLGFFGGLFIVPFESYIQAFSPSENRGQTVAAANFLSFIGVLLAPLCLSIFGKVLNISAATGFVIIGVVVFILFFVITRELFSYFINFISKMFVHPFFDLHFINYPFGPNHKEDKIAIVYKSNSLIEIMLLLGESSRSHIFYITTTDSLIHKIVNRLSGIDIVNVNNELDLDQNIMQKKIDNLTFNVVPIFIFADRNSYKYFNDQYLNEIKLKYDIRQFSVKNKSHFKPKWTRPFKSIQMVITFEEFVQLKSRKNRATKQHCAHYDALQYKSH